MQGGLLVDNGWVNISVFRVYFSRLIVEAFWPGGI